MAAGRALIAVVVVVLAVISGEARAGAAPPPASPVPTVAVTCEGVGAVAIELPHGFRNDRSARVAGGGPVRLVGPFGVDAVDATGRPVVAPAASVAGGVTCTGIPFEAQWAAVAPPAAPPPPGVTPDATVHGTLTVVVVVDATAAPSSPTTAAFEPFPFAADIQAYLAGRPGVATVAVYDARTGRSFTYAPTRTNVTASIVKVDIMGTVLRRAQDLHRGLTAWEQSQLVPMIEQSDNTAASNLWNDVGGGPGVAAFNGLIPLTSTVMGPGGYWGLTTTTAADQVSLDKIFAYPNAILSDASRAYGLSLMRSVTASQRWGVSSGPPAGTVALKNGWLPRTDGWHVNSIGDVEAGAERYVIAVLTSGSATEGDGIATIEGVSRIVWSRLPSVSFQPIGSVDLVGPTAATVAAGAGWTTVAGWAADPDAPTAVLAVHVYVDGGFGGAWSAANWRPDVAAGFPAFGPYHGFSGDLFLASGTHQVCVYPINVPPGVNTALACPVVTVSHEAFGSLDQVVRQPVDGQPSGLLLGGWAADADSAASIAVHVYVDGVFAGAAAASSWRPDVAAAFPLYGSLHGFNVRVAVPDGTHTVCVWGISVGPGVNVAVGCRQVTLASVPFGSLDTLGPAGPAAAVAGWALDPDTVQPLAVHVYVDGTFATAVLAGDWRPDVAAVYAPYGAAHGFNTAVAATPGQVVCAYAINDDRVGANALLGCRAAA